MSLNIKTSSGLQRLTPDINQTNIENALGFTPAEESVVNNQGERLTYLEENQYNPSNKAELDKIQLGDKAKWDAKSDFSGEYDALTGKPDIIDDDSGSFIIADKSSNKAFEVSPEGITNVAKLQIAGTDLEQVIKDTIEIPEFIEEDPYIEEWADIRYPETLIPEDKLPYKVEDWAKKENPALIPRDKLSIADEVSNAVPNTRKVNGKELSTDVSLMLSDLNEAPDIVETDDGYFTIVDEDRNKVLEIDNLGNINVASLNVVDSNKNEIFKVSVENGTTKVKALEVNQKSLEDIIDEKIAAIPEIEIPEVVMPTDTISKITHFEMWGGEVSLEPKPDGIIYTDAGYFTLEDGNDYDFTIAQRIPLAQGNNITFTPVEDDPDTLQINANIEVFTKLSQLDTDDNNQRVSVADKEKWNTHVEDIINNPHKVTAEQVGLGDIRVDDTDGTFTIIDGSADQNKAFEITSEGATHVYSLTIDDIAQAKTLIIEDTAQLNTAYVETLTVGGEDVNETFENLRGEIQEFYSDIATTYLARAGGTMAGAITMNGNNISGAGTITAATFQASSDARLKENLQPLQPQASILSLPTYEFDFIDGPKDQIGCLAQDLAHIHPKLVTVNENGYLTINETKLVYLLLEEMKKLQFKIVDLESQLNLLK